MRPVGAQVCFPLLADHVARKKLPTILKKRLAG